MVSKTCIVLLVVFICISSAASLNLRLGKRCNSRKGPRVMRRLTKKLVICSQSKTTLVYEVAQYQDNSTCKKFGIFPAVNKVGLFLYCEKNGVRIGYSKRRILGRIRLGRQYWLYEYNWNWDLD